MERNIINYKYAWMYYNLRYESMGNGMDDSGKEVKPYIIQMEMKSSIFTSRNLSFVSKRPCNFLASSCVDLFNFDMRNSTMKAHFSSSIFIKSEGPEQKNGKLNKK